ncbi:hypothetical protein TcasGA2_TC012970 [Tribolium castaneum]|uniref:HAT C-terminal dimerisation domain-containing protein n=1 Tax=Tribolium castaneum TaxID=7070 RepID=D7EKE3_TRICA|nr:hypothetical protein TcasGA2_TC012970 [Tribolium castaneum]
MCEDIGDSPFSLILDESTDITVDKYLGITNIYFSFKMNKIVNSFFDLVCLEQCDADSITNSILGVIQEFKLQIKNLKGIGTDNASVMIGINNGVYKKLKAHVPNLILIRCICHFLQLAVSAATKECLARNLEFLVRETYNWFQHSSSRQIVYKRMYQAINDGSDPLKIPGATRWLSIELAVTRICDQWLELKTHFQIVREKEKCYTAEMLYSMYSDDLNYAYLCFLRPVLSEVQKVNKAFKVKEPDSTKLLDDITRLLDSLIKRITTPNTKFQLFKDNIESFAIRDGYLGYMFETKVKEMKQAGFTDEAGLRERCVRFLIKLIQVIIQRLPDNIETLKTMSEFSVQNTLRAIKPDLVKLLEDSGYEPQIIEKVNTQWKSISFVKWENTDNTVKFWSEVYSFKDSVGDKPYKDLSLIAISFLILPHSNAEVERLFSQINIIKNKLRNRMKLPLLTAILNIRYGLQRLNKCCYNYEIPSSLLMKLKSMDTYNPRSDEEETYDLDEEVLNILDSV